MRQQPDSNYYKLQLDKNNHSILNCSHILGQYRHILYSQLYS